MKSLKYLAAEQCSLRPLRCDLMYIPESIIREVAARKIQTVYHNFAKLQRAARIIQGIYKWWYRYKYSMEYYEKYYPNYYQYLKKLEREYEEDMYFRNLDRTV